MKTQVIATGITGFVGSYLKESYKDLYEVLGVSRSTAADSKVISYEDLTVEVLNKSKAFIHLAGKAHDLKNVSEPEAYFEANTELTKQVFDLFLKSTCETFIYISSVKAVADVVEDVLHEDVTPDPKTVYGKSKLAAEEYLLANLDAKKKIYILRPCMIHGPGNKGNLNLLYSFIAKGIPYPMGSCHNSRSFLSVENLSFTIKHLIEDSCPSGVYNVSDDTPLSTVDLVKIIAEGLNKKAKIWAIPKFMINFLAKLGDILSLPLNTERLQKLTDNYIVSNDKLKKVLGKELPLSSKEGLSKTIQSFNND